MRMLRWILGLTLRNRERNDEIRHILGVACITDKVREARLRWNGHVQRRVRGRLCQADLGGKCKWTTEQRKTEKEMDRRRQAQYGGPRRGCRESS